MRQSCAGHSCVSPLPLSSGCAFLEVSIGSLLCGVHQRLIAFPVSIMHSCKILEGGLDCCEHAIAVDVLCYQSPVTCVFRFTYSWARVDFSNQVVCRCHATLLTHCCEIQFSTANVFYVCMSVIPCSCLISLFAGCRMFAHAICLL